MASPSSLSGLDSALVPVLLVSTAAYTLLWSLWLPSLAAFARRRWWALLADLALSLLPALITGGWSSPFMLFPLGALLLPGGIFHWRGALTAFGAYLVLDQLIGWATLSPSGLVEPTSTASLLRYTLPLLTVIAWPLNVEIWRWRRRRRMEAIVVQTWPARTPVPALTGAAELTRRPHRPERKPEAAFGAVAATGLSRPQPQTLERPPLVDLYAAIRQVVSEAEEQGLVVHLVLDGNEPTLAPGHIQLLTKAVEIGLDNIRCHARTGEGEIAVTREGSSIVLTIRDHGPGLLDGTAEPPGFHQLKRLRYRLQEVEGTLVVREDEEGGVVVTARLPWS